MKSIVLLEDALRLGKSCWRGAVVGGALCLAAPAPERAWAQAQATPVPATAVSINQSVAAANTYYVATNGSNANPGTSAQPFLTVQKGVDAALAKKNSGVSAKVVIRDGVYREAVTVPSRGGSDTNAALIVQAANIEGAIISGSNVWSGGWSASGSGWFTHAWNYNWGLSAVNAYGYGPGPSLPDLARRREMIFVNGELMRQVMTQSALVAGTFCVDEAEDKLYLYPPNGVSPNTAQIEVAVRDTALQIADRKNIVLRGIIFQHTTSFQDEDASGLWLQGIRCFNILIEDCRVRWNNARGLRIGQGTSDPGSNENITLRRVAVNNNGCAGMQPKRVKNLLVEDCETSYNNWRGNWANFISGYAPAGFKVQHTRISTWRRHRAVGNFCTGMWWDTDNSDITVEDCFMDRNYVRGMFIEYSQGPTMVKRCIIIGTRDSTDIGTDYRQGALSVSTAPDVTLRQNIVAGNEGRQYFIWDVLSRDGDKDYITGETLTLRSERHTYYRNVFSSTGASAVCWDFPVGDQSFFYDTLSSDSNRFWNDAGLTNVFLLRTNVGTVMTKNLVDWRTFSGQDTSSSRADPLFVNPDNYDFHTSDSQLATWGLPTGPS